MVAASNLFGKSQTAQQLAKLVKGDILIRSTT
jgi:hypothetical protein